MTVQELIDKLIKVGEEYPEKPTSVFERLKIWDKHDNQSTANLLKSLRVRVSPDVPEKLQEIQVMEALVDILNNKDFLYSKTLIPGMRSALLSYESFEALDTKYLPKDPYPTIESFRNALVDYWKLLLAKYETEHAQRHTKTFA